MLASVELFDETGMPALREKAERLTGYLDWLTRTTLDEHIEIITPAARGCQLSLRLREPGRGRTLQRELVERDVICDWREPDVIRVAPVPFYNRFSDVHGLVTTLQELLTR